MRENVTIWYRGANYELGRGQRFYGIWTAGAGRSQPLEWWPETPEGWSGAWNRFTGIEPAGTIVQVKPAEQAGPAVPTEQAGPAGQAGPTGQAEQAGLAGPTGQAEQAELAGPTRPTAGQAGRPGGPAAIAAGLLALGVVLGIAGLFPGYLAGSSLAQQPANLVPHVIYFAAWTASAVLILRGGASFAAGTLFGLGTSIVSFGLFFADAGQVIAGGAHLAGAGLGLVLGLAGWLVCTAGCAVAYGYRPAGRPVRLGRGGLGPGVLLLLAGLGAAAAFAPSWDSFTLRIATGASQTLTAGNAFANPAWVIAGDVAVMVALVAVVIAAALWRPARYGAALLAGAIVPMMAQAISALVQVGQPMSPAQFGYSPGQAGQFGLTISSGLTAAFWIYCVFVVALLLGCALLLVTPSTTAPGPAGPGQPGPAGPAVTRPTGVGAAAGSAAAAPGGASQDGPGGATPANMP